MHPQDTRNTIRRRALQKILALFLAHVILIIICFGAKHLLRK